MNGSDTSERSVNVKILSLNRSLVTDDSEVFSGAEMVERIATFDWSKTPLGPSETWSLALQTMVRVLLTNGFPMLLWWGPQYLSIYNDAYRAVLGTKHPWALSQPVSECWKEIWHILKPLIDTPFHGGPATWDKDILLEINRHGFVEETHFTIAYSPVPDETVPSGIGGVLATVHEITGQVLSERRLRVLHDLGSRSGEAKTTEEACAIAAESLATHPLDVPFAALYLIGPDRKTAQLAGTVGMVAGARACPAQISLMVNEPNDLIWPLAEAVHAKAMLMVTNLSRRLADQVPCGPWSDSPNTAVVIPLFHKGHDVIGLLVVGISARLPLDDTYHDFLNLVASQITTSMVNAREYEEETRRAEALAARLESEKALREAEQALHRADERFLAMASNAPVLIWENDVQGALFVNSYFLDFCGISFDAIRGIGWVRLLHPEDAATYLAAYQEAFARREPFAREVRMRRADGQYRWLLTTARPLGEDRFVGFSADITERKVAEQTLRESDQRKDEFLALLGHELRNPLAAIVLALEALARLTVLAQRAKFEQIIVRQVSVMRRLLDDLLDISRIAHGHIELHKGLIDLGDLLRAAAGTVQKAVEDREQELRLIFPPNSVIFYGDPTRLDQIIRNLLSNASKYTPRGGRIELSGRREGSNVVIRSRDNGEGIEAMDLERIFEPFIRRPKMQLGYGEPSLGIGLALTKQLTQLHGGTIEAASPGLGMGSEFTVRLPLVTMPADGNIAEEPQRQPKANLRRSILMVEDNPNIAEAMKMALEQAGQKVQLFPDGPSILSAGADLRADVVLLDIGLPGMDGYELATRLRQLSQLRSTKFIAISGFKPREQTLEEGRRLFDHYLIKPVDVGALLDLL